MHISLFQTWNKIRCVCDTRQSEGPISSKRSGVWKFFEIVEGDNSKALCKVCQEEGACISWGGKQSKLTNLQNHLRKHLKKFLELAANDKEQRTDRDEYRQLCAQRYCFLNKQITKKTMKHAHLKCKHSH